MAIDEAGRDIQAGLFDDERIGGKLDFEGTHLLNFSAGDQQAGIAEHALWRTGPERGVANENGGRIRDRAAALLWRMGYA